MENSSGTATAAGLLISGSRSQMPGWLRWLIALLATFLVLFHLYIGIYGAPQNEVFLWVHLCVAMALLFLFHPLRRRWDGALNAWSILDLLCVAGCAWTLGFLLYGLDDWQSRIVAFELLDAATALLLLILIVEAVRRTVGWAMIVLAGIFVVHALFADRFPGPFYGPPVSVQSLLQTLFVGDAGIFGVPLMVMAQYIVLFLLFGRLLQATGAGAFFNRIAFALFGHRVGGPAKAAVVSSGLFGTVSGSGVSNVLTTGTFTIPMMTRLGYRPAFAGGVESAAAVGGAIMPPVMGAVAFMMAEFTGLPYAKIALAALVPALLYYLAIYLTVHLEAKKRDLPALDRSDLPNPWVVIRREGYLALPLLVIIVMLVLGYSIVLVAVITSLGTILVSFVRPATRLSPLRMAESLEATARAATNLSVTCACAGILIGAIFATGLSFQITQIVVGFAGERVWLIVVISALIALILGTGLTASAVYITMVATVIPILKATGIDAISAHMFAFYYGVVSDITPPTALAAVAAAGIARANPMTTMLQASRIGIAAFVVPMAFVYSPALLLQGDVVTVVVAIVAVALGLFSLAVALAGYLSAEIGALRRLLFLGAAFLLLTGPGIAALAGAATLVVAALPDFLRRPAGTASRMPRPVESADIAVRENWFTRWLQRRAERESEENRELLAGAEGAAAHDLATLKRSLIADPDSQAGPRDFGCWSAWVVIGVAAIVVGWLGSRQLHALAPLAWLGWLAGITLWLVAGWRVTLRPVMNAQGRNA